MPDILSKNQLFPLIIISILSIIIGTHNTADGRELLSIPAFAFLYLLGNAEKYGYRGRE